MRVPVAGLNGNSNQFPLSVTATSKELLAFVNPEMPPKRGSLHVRCTPRTKSSAPILHEGGPGEEHGDVGTASSSHDMCSGRAERALQQLLCTPR